jgi:hypothetical protein
MIEGLLYGKMGKCQGEKEVHANEIRNEQEGPGTKSDVPGLTEEESTATPGCCSETGWQLWIEGYC